MYYFVFVYLHILSTAVIRISCILNSDRYVFNLSSCLLYIYIYIYGVYFYSTLIIFLGEFISARIITQSQNDMCVIIGLPRAERVFNRKNKTIDNRIIITIIIVNISPRRIFLATYIYIMLNCKLQL